MDLAIKHKTHVDTVLAYRIKHLNRFDKEETIKKFKEFNDEVDIDWDKINAKVEAEFAKEGQKKSRWKFKFAYRYLNGIKPLTYYWYAK